MSASNSSGPKVAVILPCLNEEVAVARTVDGFRAVLPEAEIYVYDNGSTDATARIAREHGAMVRLESRRGKGNVVRRAFADLEADVFVMADGDNTYDPAPARAMVDLVLEQDVDMVTGIRQSTSKEAYRAGHVLGNRLFTLVVDRLFDSGVTDVFSGYRVFSRRFVKSFPAASQGFEIETEMTIHALQLRMPVGELASSYQHRAEGSKSKLSTYRDGWRILMHILRLLRLFRPRQFFGLLALVVGLVSLGFAIPLFVTFFQVGQVPRLPTGVAVTGMMLTAALLWVLGVVLENASQLALEVRRLAYLAIPAPSQRAALRAPAAGLRAAP